MIAAEFDAILTDVDRHKSIYQEPNAPKEMTIVMDVSGNTSSPNLDEVQEMLGLRVRVTITEIVG